MLSGSTTRARLTPTGRLGAHALLLVLTVVSAACDKAQLLAPTGAEVTLSVADSVLVGDDSTTLTAFVTESSGTPVQNGTTVRFITSLGKLSAEEAQTRNGVATTTLTANGASGVATVKAASGATISDEVTVSLGLGAVSDIVVQASPATVPASGGTVSITATVTGENNRPLAGVPVTFSTTGGTLNGSSATTDPSGHATVQLTTNRDATVTARAGSQSETVDVDVVNATAIALAVTPTSPTVGQTVTLTVTPTIPSGGSAPRVTVDWGDGGTTDLGVLSSARATTHRYSSQGTFTITATATDGADTTSTSTTVTIGAPPSVTITASNPSQAASVTFQFTVTPATANGVDSVSVDFGDGTSVDLGAITSATTITHRFPSTADARNYTVRATEEDALGNESTSVVVVTVTGP